MIIIPDVHGRIFWEEAIKKAKEDEKIIFLGDYVDPYQIEGISKDNAFDGLKKIVKFKEDNKDNVILLVGNHDLSYWTERMPKCRFDYKNRNAIYNFFMEHINSFDLIHVEHINGKKIVFSHSGIIPKWVREMEFYYKIEKPMSLDEMPEKLNEMFHNGNHDMIMDWLNCVSPNRGGSHYNKCGSCVWGDVMEFAEYNSDWYDYKDIEKFPKNVYQIFGHTQLREDPIINNDIYACLDVRRGFRLNNEGKIEEL